MCLACPSLSFSRRGALRLIASAGAAALLPACEEMPFDLVSEEAVEQMGLEAWAALRARLPASRDAAGQALVEGVAERVIVAAGSDPRGWDIQVFAEPGMNAFVLPGRRIGIFEGMIAVAGTPDALAAVLGHEIGHLEADHARERLTAQVLRQWGERVVAFALQQGDFAYAREVAAALGVGLEFGLLRPYSRRQELEADRIGLALMARAGFAPSEAVALWRRMEQVAQGVPAFLSTHPAPAARIAALEAAIAELERASPR